MTQQKAERLVLRVLEALIPQVDAEHEINEGRVSITRYLEEPYAPEGSLYRFFWTLTEGEVLFIQDLMYYGSLPDWDFEDVSLHIAKVTSGKQDAAMTVCDKSMRLEEYLKRGLHKAKACSVDLDEHLARFQKGD